MSLLYECINGIIEGGILAAVENTTEGEEVARLCISKLRGMMVIEGDANCKLSFAIFQTIQISLYRSKICRLARVRKDRGLSPVYGVPAAGCYLRMY